MTNTIHSIAGNTNALTKVITIEANNSTVATIRIGLNIVLACLENPTRKPVPTRDRIPPTANRADMSDGGQLRREEEEHTSESTCCT